MTPIEISHAEMRAALVMAGRHIRKLNFGKRNDPILCKLRSVLREARAVSRENWPAKEHAFLPESGQNVDPSQ